MKKNYLLILLLFLLAPNRVYGGGYLFKWKFEKGKEYRYRTVVETGMELPQISEAPNTPTPSQLVGNISQTAEFTILYQVLDKDDSGIYKIKVVYESLDVGLNMGGMSIVYSSGDSSTKVPPAFSWISRLKGKSIVMRMKESGEVIEVTGIDELVKDLGEEIPEVNGILDLTDLEKYGNTFKNTLMTFPSKKLNPNDSWEDSLTLPVKNIGNLDLKNVYTFTGIKRCANESCANFTQNIALKIDGESAGRIQPGIELSDGKGDINFSLERGLLINARLNLNFDVNMNVGQGEKGGMKKLKMKTVTTTELVQ